MEKISAGSTYVTFCLPQSLRGAPFFERFCSPDAPNRTRILKRAVAQHSTGTLIVQGDTDASLDSRIVGPISASQIDAYWRPAVTRPSWPEAAYLGF